jgi:hypothetical protein
LHRLLLAGLLATALVTIPAQAGSIPHYSFTGIFSGDDSIELFSVTLGSDTLLVAQTFGYAGGVNAAGTTIASGGFDPALTLFDGAGDYIQSNDDDSPACTHVGSDTGNCFDSYLSNIGTFAPGTYTIALTVSGNSPGNSVGDFSNPPGSGSFTCTAHGGPEGGLFCDVTAAVRRGSWALDVSGLGVTSVVDLSQTATPEPASLFLMLGAAGTMAGKFYRNRPAAGRAESHNSLS